MRTLVLLSIVLFTVSSGIAQRTTVSRNTARNQTTGNAAVVVDERLSVLRNEPGLYTTFIKRLKTGARLTVFEEKEVDGASFYRVAETTAVTGWIQTDAVAATFRKNDDQRLARLILGSSGFVQIQRSAIFLELFEDSAMRPTILLLFGDLVEDHAGEISLRAAEELNPREMAAAQAPIHSFYLNYKELDIYRELGIRFLFNAYTATIHYDGTSWFEITRKHAESPESIEARERIRALTEKMNKKN